MDLHFPVPTMRFPSSNPYDTGKTQGNGIEDMTTWALRAAHHSPNEFNTAFFSKRNVDYIQSRIVRDVKKLSGFTVARQSDQALGIIMLGMYIEYSKNAGGAANIDALNRAVLAECVRQVISGINAYSGYVRDASTNAKPIPRPENPSIKGARVLPGFLPL
jgi:Family of unknown function (DUF5761)